MRQQRYPLAATYTFHSVEFNTTHNPHTHTEYRKREKVREGERAKEREKQLESQM